MAVSSSASTIWRVPCRLDRSELPQQTCLVFGSEGPGLTDELVAVCEQLVAITQYGSTRSLNAGAAAAIAMYHWALRWARTDLPWIDQVGGGDALQHDHGRVDLAASRTVSNAGIDLARGLPPRA